MKPSHAAWYNHTVRTYLTKEEIAGIMQKSDRRGLLEIAHTWAWITAAFVLVGAWPNVLTVVIALFVLGGKQLACAIIMHDCSHNAYFNSPKLNTFFGNWFGAYPILQNVEQYRPYHLEHHRYVGLTDDPDLSLTKGYPTTVVSMVRKIARDLLLATGVKGQVGALMMHVGYLKYSLGGLVIRLKQQQLSDHLRIGWRNLRGPLAANGLLFGILWACGHPALYGLWLGALLTTYNFSLRVRSMAEHSMIDEREDPHKNSRTTYANWLERMLFAPHYVNYHAEHHLMMAAPPYNYPKLHRLLLERGFFAEGTLEPGYGAILRKAISRHLPNDVQTVTP